jgi:putative Mg2+ transporter-C (MgtC) family protein
MMFMRCLRGSDPLSPFGTLTEVFFWEGTEDVTLLDFVICIGCSLVFGFLIGLERQLTGHTAGIRTNILVCMGACMFTLFSRLMDATDTTRVAAQVVTGIGFLCTGIIFKEGLNVRGLNTAATIWCTAAIGVLCSSGLVLYATAAAAILIASNLFFRFVADRVSPLARIEEYENTYVLSVSCIDEYEFGIRASIMNCLNNTKLHLTNLESADEIGGKVEIEATVQVSGRRRDEVIEKLTAKIALEKGVNKVGWKLV